MRFLFDECLGRPLMQALWASLLPADATFTHFTEVFAKGTKDKVWIPQLAEQGGWTVITGDSGKGSKHGGKLPAVCREYRLTHVMFSSKLQQQPSAMKVMALGAQWARIFALCADPPGTRAVLRFLESGNRVSFPITIEPPPDA